MAAKVFAQDIPQSQVPSMVVNNFQKTFPKAFDVEWGIKGNLFKVEFETGLFGTDHDAWFNNEGTLVKHKEEISKTDLPKKVLDEIDNNYGGYRISDSEKITEGNTVTYIVELKSFTEEWKVAFDAEGNVLSKISD